MACGVVSFHLIALACFVAFPYTHAFGGIAVKGCPHSVLWTQTSLWFSTAAVERRRTQTRLCAKDENPKDDFKFDSNMPVIMRGSQEDEISSEVWENVDTGEPPKSVIMRELLGINFFTYILAATIAVFLTLNFVFGPGWLGQELGMKGTGTFTDVSTSLPSTVNLSDPDFLL